MIAYFLHCRLDTKKRLFAKTGKDLFCLKNYGTPRKMLPAAVILRFTIVSNLFVCRIFREKQYAERRLRDFDDALSREAVRFV